MKNILTITFLFLFKSIACANLAVHSSDDQIEKAQDIVLGILKEDEGKIVFLVEEALKGEAKKQEKIIITENSKLAWTIKIGGGLEAPSKVDLLNRFNEKKWFNIPLVLVGKIDDGKWVSSCYDWSVWTSGESTNKDEHKNLSLDELIEVIKMKQVKLPEPKAEIHEDKQMSESIEVVKTKQVKSSKPKAGINKNSQIMDSSFKGRPKLPAKEDEVQPPTDESRSIPWIIAGVMLLGVLFLLFKKYK